ncbi:MAG: MFS transporter [Anaerolineales bacterium]|nr:MFS transporter [Anaerolineales bacterium]
MKKQLIPALTSRPSIWHIVGAGFLLRLLIDTSGQMLYPFVPIFAAGLGVSAVIIGRLLSLQSLVGIFAPIFGNLADRYGYRPFMRLGLFSVGAGLIVFAASTTITLAVIGSLILGFGFSLFTPNLMAYLSANLPSERRSRGMGAVELAWGLSGFIGIAPLGIAIARWGWRLPLIGLGIVLLLASFVPIFFPQTAQFAHAHSPGKQEPQLSVWTRAKQFLDLGNNREAAWAAILGTTLTLFAASHLISSYGQWLFLDYGLESAELGRIAGILGLGAFAAIILISTAGDRFGALTGAKIGALVSTFTYLLLPLLNDSLTWLVVGLFIVFFFYQFAMVNAIILTSMQIPAQRGKMMTLGAALGTSGISLANFTGPIAFATFGPWGLALPSGIIMFVLWLILTRYGRTEPEFKDRSG